MSFKKKSGSWILALSTQQSGKCLVLLQHPPGSLYYFPVQQQHPCQPRGLPFVARDPLFSENNRNLCSSMHNLNSHWWVWEYATPVILTLIGITQWYHLKTIFRTSCRVTQLILCGPVLDTAHFLVLLCYLATSLPS